MSRAAHLVVFRVEGERFALPSRDVERVVERATVEPLPWMSGPAAGVLRHEGVWIPAFDPAVKVGLATRAAGRATALILRRGATRFALVVDEALGRRALRAHRLRPEDAATTVSRYEELEGVEALSDEEGLIGIFDADGLFGTVPPRGENAMHIPENRTQTLSLLEFRAGGAELGLLVEQVREVLPYEAPRAHDDAPDFIDGFLFIRDRRVPVIQLRRLLEIGAAEMAAGAARMILVRVGDADVALAVDDVSDVRRLSTDALLTTPAFLQSTVAEYVDAVARVDNRLVLLLRLERLFGTDQRRLLEDLVGRLRAEP